jgi:hypothetical protein
LGNLSLLLIAVVLDHRLEFLSKGSRVTEDVIKCAFNEFWGHLATLADESLVVMVVKVDGFLSTDEIFGFIRLLLVFFVLGVDQFINCIVPILLALLEVVGVRTD